MVDGSGLAGWVVGVERGGSSNDYLPPEEPLDDLERQQRNIDGEHDGKSAGQLQGEGWGDGGVMVG